MNVSNIGTNIKDQLKKKNMSQVDLAKKLNVHKRTITLWVHGRNTPTLELVVAMSEIFDCSMEELVQ